MANQQLGFYVVGKSNAAEVMGKAGKEAEKLRKKLEKAFDMGYNWTGRDHIISYDTKRAV
jgi:hypothetical protein